MGYIIKKAFPKKRQINPGVEAMKHFIFTQGGETFICLLNNVTDMPYPNGGIAPSAETVKYSTLLDGYNAAYPNEVGGSFTATNGTETVAINTNIMSPDPWSWEAIPSTEFTDGEAQIMKIFIIRFSEYNENFGSAFYYYDEPHFKIIEVTAESVEYVDGTAHTCNINIFADVDRMYLFNSDFDLTAFINQPGFCLASDMANVSIYAVKK